MVQHRKVDAWRVNPMAGLAELVWVTQKDEVARHAGHRENIRQCHLARFVHDQVIQFRGKGWPSEQPRGPRDNVDIAVAKSHLDGRSPPAPLAPLRVAAIALIGLLYGSDRLAAAPRFRHYRVEKVADDLVTIGSNPDAVAALDQLQDDLSTDGRLPGSGWALDSEISAIEARCKQHGDVSRPFACLNQRRSFDYTLDARRLQAKEIAGGPKLPSTTKTVIDDVLAKPQKRVALIVGWDRTCWDQRGRVRHLGVDTAAKFDPTGEAVNVGDVPRRFHAPWVVRLVANPDLVLLGRVEVVAEDVRLLLLANLAAELEATDRLGIRHQLFIGEGPLAVVLPPFGLCLPPVPVKAVAQQVACLLLC